MLRVGLTGGVSSGKSTVAGFFREMGAAVLDADRIVADLYRAGRAGAAAVRALFGPEMLSSRGAVRKKALAGKIFADTEAREALEGRIHPLVVAEIRRRFDEAERAGREVAIAEASQIFEGGFENEFDRVVLVVSPEIVRMKRWRERGLEPEELSRRMAAQIVENEARKKADDVVVNAGSKDDLRRKIAALYGRYSRPERGSSS